MFHNPLNAIELRHLRYFLAVADAGTFRGAAERLHVSQPPLTRQIQQLEEILAVRLFNRQPRGVELTETGVLFHRDASNLMLLLEQSVSRAQLAEQGQLGRLDVGIFGSAIVGAIPLIIRQFRENHPHVEIVLHNMNRAEQLQALRENRLTVGFNRFFTQEPDLCWENVQSEPVYLAVNEHHVLASRHSVRLKELKGHGLILYPRTVRPSFIDHMTSLLERQGVTPHIAHEVDDVMTAVALVSSNLGSSIVTESATNLRLPHVRYIPIDAKDGAVFDLSVIYRKDDRSSLLQAFLRTAKEVAVKL
jgi:LysR family transcriptional regulator, benzoate and cis,cis-muconate-responsive activator of ben and cat genes